MSDLDAVVHFFPAQCELSQQTEITWQCSSNLPRTSLMPAALPCPDALPCPKSAIINATLKPAALLNALSILSTYSSG